MRKQSFFPVLRADVSIHSVFLFFRIGMTDLTRQAIGRSCRLGSLYNIRTDEFVSGNLLGKVLPSNMIETIDINKTTFYLDFHNSQKETFKNLDIEASLKLGLMAGLLNVEGSAKYLTQTKTDSKTVRATFICKINTKEDKLLIADERLQEYLLAYVFENPDVTHVVTGIKWGANVAATFERTVEKQDDVQRIEGTLSIALKKPTVAITGDGQLEYDNRANNDLESLKISFSGDVLIEDCPQTIEQVLDVYGKVPSLVNSANGGKGQQMVFLLTSLEQIAKMTQFERRITR